jgi:GTPase SAR1 family protein
LINVIALQVLLLGQYSVGKTSFIQYMLERDFPGAHIGPEPTTDRFMAIMFGPSDRVTPGNAAAVQADKPFRGLSQFGTAFLR